MAAKGFWADTIQEFAPGVGFGNNADTPAATVNTRSTTFFSPLRRASWFGAGEYPNIKTKINWATCYTNQNVRPTNPADHTDAGYNWALFDSYNSMAELVNGVKLQVMLFINQGRQPQWFIDLGYTFMPNAGASSQPVTRVDLEASRTEIMLFLTAISTRYALTRKFWSFQLSEFSIGTSDSFPVGFSQAAHRAGLATLLNSMHDQFGGRVTIGLESMTEAVSALCYPTIANCLPDMRIGQHTTSIIVSERDFQTRPLIQSTEPNGQNVPLGAYSGISNPFGYDGSTAAHLATAEEYLFWVSRNDGDYNGQRPTHCLICVVSEFSGGNISDALWAAALTAAMEGGTDANPALPDNYSTAPPSGGAGTAMVAANGSVASATTGNLIPGLMAKDIGDGLLLFTDINNNVATLQTGPPSWTLFAETSATNHDGAAIYFKFAEDTLTNSSSLDYVDHRFWGETNQQRAVIFRLTGGLYPTVADMVAHLAIAGQGQQNDTASPELVVTVDNCFIFAVGTKMKGPTSNGATCTSPAGLTSRALLYYPDGSSIPAFCADYVQQTTATTIAAGTWDFSINESTRGAAILLALRTSGGEDTTDPVLHATDEPTGTAQSQTEIQWSWNDATDNVAVVRYNLQYRDHTDTDWIFLAIVTQADKTADSGYLQSALAGGTEYDMRYNAEDAAGNLSAWSDFGTETTDTPVDATPPTYGGITSVSFDAAVGVIIITHTQGTDGVTAQADLKYFVVGALSPAAVDFDTYLEGPFDAADSFSFSSAGYELGTWNFGLVCVDAAPNASTNTDTESVTLTAPPQGLIRKCQLNTGTTQSGTHYLAYAPKGTPISVNWSSPSSSGAELATFNADGEIPVLCPAGDYDFVLGNDDGTWRITGEFTSV